MLDKIKMFLTENSAGLILTGLLLSMITLVIQFSEGPSHFSNVLWGAAGLLITGSYIGIGKPTSHVIGIALVYFSVFASGISHLILFILGTLLLFNVIKVRE